MIKIDDGGEDTESYRQLIVVSHTKREGRTLLKPILPDPSTALDKCANDCKRPVLACCLARQA